MSLLELIGKKIISFFRYIIDLLILLYQSFKVLFVERKTGKRETFKVILNQIIFTGVDALLIVSRISLLLGIVVTVLIVTQLSKVGISEFMGKILIIVIIRELGPLITAFVVTGRSGSAIATELGSMKVSQEIEALEVMGINPLKFIVAPRVIGSLIATVCLSIYFNILAIIGGFIGTRLKLKMSFYLYLQRISEEIAFYDIFISLLKSMVFGITISLISCYHGLGVKHSSTEVPQATTLAIVNSITFCFAFNTLTTVLFVI